jgi:16S rRNA (cytidine1402-2'-O)-methyltransferase
MTKLHEEFRRGSLGELQAHFRDHPPRGEITLVLAPGEEGPEAGGMDRVDEVAARALARALLGEGRSPSRAARELAARLDVPRNRAYEIVLSVSCREEGETADLPDEGVP